MLRKDTHVDKAESYDIGRPNYPESFFDYLYKEIGMSDKSVIADIGAGTGKITKKFLERGNKVFAVEPDKNMMKILKTNLSQFTNCVPLESTAENTGILSNSIDFIFCGNSYMWFNRNDVIPEFQRIIRDCKSQNIIIARLGPGDNIYSKEFLEINNRFSKPVSSIQPNNSAFFANDMFVSETFNYTLHQGFDEFLHGCLSASSSPNIGDNNYEEYCLSLKKLFDKYSTNGQLEGQFCLYCTIGDVKNLIM